MDVVEYLNEKNEIEIKEKRLFEIINKLDKESYKLYSEVIDLDLNSFYKIDNLYTRISNLADLLEEIKNAYDYLIKLEEKGLVSAKNKMLIKKFLIVALTGTMVCINNLYGLIGLMVGQILASITLYSKKMELIYERLETLDNLDLSIIGTTLENACNFLKGKMNRLYDMEENNQISEDVIIANNYIGCYLEHNLPSEELESLPLVHKQIIVKILQKDLNSKSDDIYELLSELRNKNDSEIKLTKELN